MVLELLHALTERDGERTPDVPGRSTAHPPRLAGLHALQEVVVLLLLAGLLRPVEEVVLGEKDPTELVTSRLEAWVVAILVLQPDPGEGDGVGDEVVKLGVVDDDSVADVGVEATPSSALTSPQRLLRNSPGARMVEFFKAIIGVISFITNILGI